MTALAYAFAKFLCWCLFRFRFGLQVDGREHVPKAGAFIVASNHVSYLDPPVVGVACPQRLRFMARGDLFHIRWLGLFLRSIRVIPLRRGEADLPAIRQALDALRGGEPVAIFPEGGRQLSGTLGVAKRGVGVLADAARVPVIPALVSGTFQALPPDATRLHRAKIRVAFGPPITYTYTTFLSTTPSRDRRRLIAEAVTAAWRQLEAHR